MTNPDDPLQFWGVQWKSDSSVKLKFYPFNNKIHVRFKTFPLLSKLFHLEWAWITMKQIDSLLWSKEEPKK